MIVDIPLDGDQEPGDVGELDAVGNDAFLAAVLGGEFRLHHRSAVSVLATAGERQRPVGDEPTGSLLLRAAHVAFCGHLPLSLSPDVLWYAVVHEVAVHVRLNADLYAGVFGADPSGRKRTIVVRDNSLLDPEPDWAASIRLVREPLAEAVGAELVELFRPAFSTTTPDDVSSVLVALMDVVSPYYEYRWDTLCGIPRVRLEGTANDWALLAERVGELASWFEPLAPWFAELRPVLKVLARTAAGWPADREFWRSLYKWRSDSGGDFVSGWITAFFAHTRAPSGPPKPRTAFGWRGQCLAETAFPSHVSTVPFAWDRPDGQLRMAFLGGVLGIERDGEYVRPRLGNAVVELVGR